MKKLFVFVFVFGILAALAISACQVKEEGEFAPEGKVFTATMEAFDDDASGVDTKTSLDAGGSVLWKMGDQVSIFAGSTINEHYQVTDASDGRTAAALNRVESPGFVAGGDIDNNVAFYPYAETAELAKNGSAYVIRDIALPATQTYAQASFGNGAFPMTAVTSSTRDYNLKFKNVLGGLKLQLKGTATIASISITGNNNEVLCGDAVVDVSTTTAPSISLNDASATNVTLDCGNGVQLNETTATAFIIALPPMTMTGGFTVTVTDTEGATMEIKTTKTQTITRSNILAMPAVMYEGTAPEHQYVDLGLTSGLKWATCNVGANAPEEYGDYFAWGETEPYYTEGHSQDSPCDSWRSRTNPSITGYNWASYKWCNGSSYTQTKYCTSSSYGTVDNNTLLDPEDDAASVNWGGTWRMPTDAEWTELRTECTWTWTTQKGVNGRLVTGPNGNSIFLPAAGSRYDTNLGNTGSYGYYWSSSLLTGGPSLAWGVYFYSDVVSWCCGNRFSGQSVRSVTDEGVRVSVTNVSLNNDSLNLTIDETATLTATVTPSNATQPTVIWSSSDNTVATVDYTGVVTAVASGTATITAKTFDGGFTAACTITVSAAPEAVDLGLPSGLKWASFNVGANAPEEYGDYFAWGGTEPQGSYDWTTCPFRTSGDSWDTVKFSKYNTESDCGPIDNNIFLDPEDDAARVNWGSSWRMPTDTEWDELIAECTWTGTTQNGVNGRLVTGPNGNSIFLPAAGNRYNTDLINAGLGLYWSSFLCTLDPRSAWYVRFNSGSVDRDFGTRSGGISVRAVTK